MVLDSTRYAIERSARVLRGMTFWGKIRNAFSDDPQVRRQCCSPERNVTVARINVATLLEVQILPPH